MRENQQNKYTGNKVKKVVESNRNYDIENIKEMIQHGLTKEQRMALYNELNELRYGKKTNVVQQSSHKKNSIFDVMKKLNISKLELPNGKKIPKMSARGKVAILALGITVGGVNFIGQHIKGATSKPKVQDDITYLEDVLKEEENQYILNTEETTESKQKEVSSVYDAKDIEAFSDYPGYIEYLKELKKLHPNWNFELYKTGLDFSSCVESEMENGGVSIQDDIWSSPWYTMPEVKIDGETWILPSKEAVECMMDTRNFLNENQIFQFENIEFSEKERISFVESMLKDVPWANAEKFSYTTTSGEVVTLDKSFSDIIYDSAKSLGVSPIYLASKILLEQGGGDIAGKTGCGTVDGYVGYYNYGNINSYGKDDEIWKTGLEHAKEAGWTDPITSVEALARFIKEKYIDNGQKTIYSIKYNFDNNGILSHQYMTNFTGAYTEASKVSNCFKNYDLLDSQYFFVIPVYENMPDKPCQMPDGSAYLEEEYINGGIMHKEKDYDEER